MTHSLDDALVVEWARKTVAEARAGRFDLRDLGKAMTGKWDQDFPAAVLAFIVRAALEAAGVAELREDMVERLWIATKHGDDEHRTWLREAFTAFFAGKLVPEPRGKGRKEAMVAELREENERLRKALAYAKEYLAGTYEVGAIAEIQKIELAGE